MKLESVEIYLAIWRCLNLFLLAATLVCGGALSVSAQQNLNSSDKQTKTETIERADLSITANVTARELRFETVPHPKVEFPGLTGRATAWEADRQNLPRPVEPGVTYRNIGIELRIASRFADIERIVAEALGEIPATDDAPPAQPDKQPRTNSPANQNQSDQRTAPLPKPR